MENQVLAVVRASALRRDLGLSMLGGLGALLIFIAVFRPPASPGWQVFLLGLGVVALWGMERMRRATAQAVELTRAGLRSSDGEVIAPIDQIASVDRGPFAFKPSNGFILRLKSSAPRRWQPGLWWRLGRRVGIGGVTPGAQAKAMAERIAMLLAER